MRWRWRFDIANREGDVYLTRFRFPLLFGWAILLHVMRRPDEDRCLHDHPWWFLTLVLWGGYVEEVDDTEAGRAPGDGRVIGTQWNRPGMLLYRSAEHTHRIAALPKGRAVTLVLRGPKVRLWGFRNGKGDWRPWDAFVNWAGSVSWCEDLPRTKVVAKPRGEVRP
jgi:hypothetical protein